MQHDRKYLLCAFAYLIIGLLIGVLMGASGNHSQLVAHAHILLVGFVASFVYGVVHKLWLSVANRKLATVQFYLHQLATVTMCSGLLLLYGGIVPESTIGPILGMSSSGVFIAALLMTFMILKYERKAS